MQLIILFVISAVLDLRYLQGKSALIEAYDRVSIVDLLIKAGANVDLTDKTVRNLRYRLCSLIS